MDVPVLDFGNIVAINGYNYGEEVDIYRHCVDELYMRVEQIEQKLVEIEEFSVATSKKQLKANNGSSGAKEKDKEKHIPGLRKHLLDASKREAAAAKRMQDLMRHFGTILNQITRHKLAWPFMQPVDVEGLGLDDYYEVIDKPMDFSTIKNQMEVKDGTGYRNVRHICADVRLVFNNAMKYNEEKSNVHSMAKTLLKKFEEKWLQFLPKVVEEEKRREEEEAEAQLNEQLVHEAAYAKMARDVSHELYKIDTHLEELREKVVQNCRKFSIEEKRKLGEALAKLSPEGLSKVLEIVAQSNHGFQATAEEVDLDINAQTESTLWRLKFFVKDALENQGKSSGSTSISGNKNNNATITGPSNNNNTNNNNNNMTNKNKQRKREISDAIAKAAKKKSKKIGS